MNILDLQKVCAKGDGAVLEHGHLGKNAFFVAFLVSKSGLNNKNPQRDGAHEARDMQRVSTCWSQ